MKINKILMVSIIFIFIFNLNICVIVKADANNSNETIVSSDGTGDYTNIQDAISAGKKNIIIKDGTYLLSSALIIKNNNTVITGASKTGVKIIQTNTAADGVVIYADNVKVSNLTVDCQKYAGRGTAIVEGHSNNVMVSNCIVYGSNSNFSIYFAGKDYSSDEDTIKAVENGDLDKNNVVKDCTVYSTNEGDGVILALQRYGKLLNNTIIGTRIAFYMCNSSQVCGNTINDSKSHGIFVSIPAFNNIIENNIINNCALSGIKVAAETEHTNPEINNHTYMGTGFTIDNNKIINPAYFGIEIDELADSTIVSNKLSKCDYVGIYMLRSNNLHVVQNCVIDSGYGVNEPKDSNYSKNLSKNIKWDLNSNAAIFVDYNTKYIAIISNSIDNMTSGCAHAIFESNFDNNEAKDNFYVDNVIRGSYGSKTTNVNIDYSVLPLFYIGRFIR
ncbi:parallel beta-helix repeat protein [Clostridium acetobutylicum]|uniref:Surface-layer related glycoprotein n=1 Tax=Clostridium acetobutylicum (strain ATCC 824 / DSM 792 / JCM 1419 / IAM 19013 / LMG 5710 / NBRC 13948 / NRRL B-527 / VKM B-1787 / 2291 / W) TaxID=272562 RepID=Q97HP3_CLOAB|nr:MULTISPECIES: right-handed parallel beta-helix repeat-containing protein [Clostridium]AAK79927.1 Surface-layer related glycoprotein [Clostridium acetobutylicum ATCC 824]ADZ21020.1 Surface-layer related glycoprotein [Clostridium acetobutylicum EA 2018]AEI32098.1 surface-layer related glycoprotein [Clostridium acetobutylicum DSM 1731]AWV79641.1 hypothetical protein DK921_05905 [Clostridium acetobutylicum]MBC2394386.1 hypothetical protein [Clostridium acetobutylicum]